MAKHSKIGASSCERWWNCPGSVAESAKYDAPATSSYAAQGTAAHELAEDCLLRNVKPERRLYDTIEIECKVSGKLHEIEVTDDMVAAVSEYLYYIKSELLRLPSGKLQIEQQLSLSHLHPDAFGTADAVIVSPFELVVIDYKHGAGVKVSIKDNKQALYYAVGAYQALSDEQKAFITTIKTAIVQPRVEAEKPYSEAIYTVEELLKFQGELKTAMGATAKPEAPLVVGSHCRWCVAKMNCKAQHTMVQESARIKFGLAPQKPPKPEDLTPEQLAVVLKQADLVKDWCDEVVKYAKKRAENGQEIPGYKLVEKQGHRKWLDEETIIERYTPEFGDKIYTKKLLSPAQMEKLLKSKRKSEIQDLYHKPVTGATLVPLTDERKAKGSKALETFAYYID